MTLGGSADPVPVPLAEMLAANRDLIPAPYGYSAATSASGRHAVPLVAGFALTTARRTRSGAPLLPRVRLALAA
jgi:hypothetical protein